MLPTTYAHETIGNVEASIPKQMLHHTTRLVIGTRCSRFQTQGTPYLGDGRLEQRLIEWIARRRALEVRAEALVERLAELGQRAVVLLAVLGDLRQRQSQS
mgnify:FL=1